MRYTPLERQIHTLYVPEDFIDRLAERTTCGDLLPGHASVDAVVVRRRQDYLRVYVPDPRAARALRFNVLDVWRVDNQTIQFRVRYRPRRGERFRELWRSAPAPPFVVIMLPVIAVLAFIVPEVLLMPIFGIAQPDAVARTVLRPLGRQLKAIADGAA